ncbi:MAG: hypothetical protein ACQESC_00165 [Nanobdellota archaeon]
MLYLERKKPLSKIASHLNVWKVLLIVVILAVIFFQSYFIIQSPAPSYETFFTMRQVEHIKQTGAPIIQDTQSYQGRTDVSHIIFYYIIAGLSFLIPGYALFKFLGVALTIVLLVLVFVISKHLFKKEWIALFLTTIAGFTPTIFVSQINTVLPEVFFLILFLFLILFYFKSDHQKFQRTFIVLISLATLVSPISLLLIIGFVIYFLFLRFESIPIKKHEIELVLYSGLFAIWYHLIIYKKLISLYGFQIISQNVPEELLLSMFKGLNVPLMIGFIGVPLVGLGLVGIYYLLFERDDKNLLLLTAFIFAFGLAIWLGFIPLKTGLLYATLMMVFISGHTIRRLSATFDKTIFPSGKIFLFVFFILILLLSFTPLIIYPQTITDTAPTNHELDAMDWMKNNIDSSSTVLGDITDGHLLATEAGVKTMYDTNFIFAPNPRERFDSARTIFLTRSEVSALEVISKYSIDFIYLSPNIVQRYPVESRIFDESGCFNKIYSNEKTEVYNISCNPEI